MGSSETLICICLHAVSLYAPFPAIRTVYSELKRQLFWGFPLRLGIEGAGALRIPDGAR